MGKYGLKIKNYEAGSVYEYNLGARDYYEVKDAMLTNSLFLDFLLENAQVVGTPGEGFGSNGEGFFRLTAFNTPERTSEAMDRLKNLLK